MTTFIKTWRFATLYTLFIITLSLAPLSKDLPLKDVNLIDKWVHFIMYALVPISALCDIITKKADIKSPSHTATILLFYAITLGGLMEIGQSFTTYRSAEWLDFLANSIGALLGFGIFLAFFHFKNKKHQKHHF